jgi:hypothetical protein
MIFSGNRIKREPALLTRKLTATEMDEKNQQKKDTGCMPDSGFLPIIPYVGILH